MITEPHPPTPFKPAEYVVQRAVDPIHVDGVLNEASWGHAAWTAPFGPIYLTGFREPFLATRAKLLWDDEHLYAAVELEEPNLVGHVTTKDEEIYRDNDIELFVDVDGDAQDYIELEFNCLGTIWDMFLPKEYNRGGLPHSHPRVEDSPPWDLEGLRVAVRLDGSLNYPLDTDRGWTIEMALPWAGLQATRRPPAPLNRPGTLLRLNFSRVQHTWPRVFPIVDWTDRGPESYDWTWSQCLVYNMHSAESWGRAVLSGRPADQAPEAGLLAAFAHVPPPTAPLADAGAGMVRIPAGTYPIGPDPTDPGDSPAGSVRLDAFDLDRAPVTVARYAAFLNDGAPDDAWNPDMARPDFCGIVRRDDGRFDVLPGRGAYPVTLMTLTGAQAFAAWAGCRLPTEWEWEAAARGLDGRPYPWGDEAPTVAHANHDYRVGHTTAVGSYPAGATPEGILDLAGNVWELCAGTWAPYPWAEVTTPPRTAGACMRGGSWVTPAANLGAAYRNGQKGAATPMVGFRCARDAG